MTHYIPINYKKVEYNLKSKELDVKIIYRDSSDIFLKKLKNYIPSNLYKDKTEMEIIINVSNYVSCLWKHNGKNRSQKNDPISILKEIKTGRTFCCVEYSIITTGFLNSLGICARTVGLKTKDVETRASNAGHVVAEAYLKAKKGWVMIDTQCNLIPTKKGKPLSIYEFQQELFGKSKGLNTGKKYMSWIKPYLYYLDIRVDQKNKWYKTIDDRHSKNTIRRIMLIPIGAKKPQVFQRKHAMKNWGIGYTNSLKDFYQEPVIRKS